jgi:hypothetical protein
MSSLFSFSHSLFDFLLFYFVESRCKMSVDNVSVSSGFAAADRGAVFIPPASYLSETTLVSYTTTSSGSETETISGPASTYRTTKTFINHYEGGNQDCYPETEGTKWDDATAIICCPQYFPSCFILLHPTNSQPETMPAQQYPSKKTKPSLTSGWHLHPPRAFH